MKKVKFAFTFAALLVISLLLPTIASASCLSNCDAQYNTCINGCRNIKDEARSTSCVNGCMRGYEGCKRRCGGQSLNAPADKFLALGTAPTESSTPFSPSACPATNLAAKDLSSPGTVTNSN